MFVIFSFMTRFESEDVCYKINFMILLTWCVCFLINAGWLIFCLKDNNVKEWFDEETNDIKMIVGNVLINIIICIMIFIFSPAIVFYTIKDMIEYIKE